MQSGAMTTHQIASSTKLPELTAAVDDGIPGFLAKSDKSSTESFVEAPRLGTQRHGKLLQEHLRQGSEDVYYDHTKYGENGYFGFENIGTPEGTEPGKLSEREKLEILNTETLHDPKASFDESNDDQGLHTC